MNPDQLADALIQSVDDIPGDFEGLKQDVAQAVEKFSVPRKAIMEELVEDEQKFYKTIAKIIDKKTDTGIADAVDYPFILGVVKLTLGKARIYDKMKK